MSIDIIILAGVAVFVLMRLYGVLGQDVGHDKKTPSSRDSSFDSNSKVIELTPQQLERAVVDISPESDESVPDALRDDVRALHDIDKSFRLSDFMEGAQAAFDMVMEAFAKDDRETLKMLLSKDLYDTFVAELKDRAQQDEYSETTLVSILEAEPEAIDMQNTKATLKVRFVTEQISVKRTRDGETVEDSASSIEQIIDHWAFTRDMRSNNPNWTIIST